MNILGISGLYHDSAAALICDGKIVAAAQEERFTRKKHDKRIPENAMKYVCAEGGNCLIDYVVFYDNSLFTLDRFISNTLACGQDSRDLINLSFDELFKEKLWAKELIYKSLEDTACITENTRFLMTKHHISHASSAFYPSPYEKSLILTLDGVGEWTTLSIGIGSGNKIELKEELKYPHSLGLFYSAFTYFCGFKVNEGDYKFMGLAPYGSPIYEDVIREHIIDVKEDGSFRLNLQYFDYQNGRTMIHEAEMAKLFGGGRRLPETEITFREMNIASSVQKITEDIIIKLAKHAKEKYGQGIENLCIAGGVGLNCVANGKLRDEAIFKNVWIQPAAGDAGGSLGAALYCWYSYLGNTRTPDEMDSMQGSYLGISYTDEEIKKTLDVQNSIYREFASDLELAKYTAKLLKDGKVTGLFEGRMEFGPRSLGNRSIIADPRSEAMQSRMNLAIKFRESFRPFAPSVLEEYAGEYFENGGESPYMLFVSKVLAERREKFDLKKALVENMDNMLPVVNTKRSDVPAITHVDYSARVQTVNKERNLLYYSIIDEFRKLTGCACIVNTSFNVRGEPIVCSPEDAWRCFMRTGMDALVIGHFVLLKEEQPKLQEDTDWRNEYELD